MSKIFFLLVLGLTTLTSTIVRADDILEAHKKALGSKDAIEKIRTIRRTGDVEMKGQYEAQGTVVEAGVIGKKAYQKTELTGFEQTLVWNGDKAWIANTFAPVQVADGNQLGTLQGIASVNPLIGMVGNTDSSKIKSLGEVEFEGVKCDSYKIDELTVYVGKEDKMYHGMSGVFSNEAFGDAKIKVVYSDFKEHEGVKFPEKVVASINDGDIVSTTKFTKTEINPELKDDLFKKPE